VITIDAVHRRARLLEIQDLLLVAHDADGVARAMLQLVAFLQDDDDAHPAVQLVQEAYDLLTNPDSRLNVRDWTRAAAPFVRS
jgi:hypothetical protein